jgi:hypothetical protein
MLTWSSTNAASCTASGAWSSGQLTAGTLSVTPSTAGNATYTLVCQNAAGVTATGSATLAVDAAAAVSLSVSPTTLTLGAAATLTWSTTNASNCAASGAWSGATSLSGTQSVTPSSSGTVTYTLSCNNAAGTTVTENSSVAVEAPATISIFTSPSSITLGASSLLSWSVTNGSNCLASGAWTGGQASSGNQTVAPSAAGTGTYVLTCQNAAGTMTTASAALEIVPSAPAGRLYGIRSYEYVVSDGLWDAPAIYTDIAGSSADLILLGGGFIDGPLDRAAADPSGKKLIFGYAELALASAGQYPALFVNGNPPAWCGNQVAGYPGLYSVQYWNPAWEAALFQSLDMIVADGYDGIFVDGLGGDAFWQPGNPEGNPVYANATPALITLLTNIRAHLTSTFPGKQIYLMGNGPEGIGVTSPQSLTLLDAILNESLYWGQPLSNGYTSVPTTPGGIQYVTSVIAPIYQNSGLPIFGGDYPLPLSDPSVVLPSFEFYSSHGWVPSVTTAYQTDAIFSTGPFMAMAKPSNSAVVGNPNLTNYLSGGVAFSASMTGGNQGDYFLGGPGQNTIIGGAGDDMIYAHPANAAQKMQLILDLSSTLSGSVTTPPSVSVSINGTVVVPATPITALYGTSSQRFQLDQTGYPPISSLVITVSNTNYIDQNNDSNIEINDIIYGGVNINLGLGAYTNGASSIEFTYSNNGTVTFPASAFAVIAPFARNTSDTIDGGAGSNTVTYRGPYSNYTISKQANGSYLVTSKSTAEGPDTLTNIQTLVFSDQQITLQ